MGKIHQNDMNQSRHLSMQLNITNIIGSFVRKKNILKTIIAKFILLVSDAPNTPWSSFSRAYEVSLHFLRI